MTLRVIDNSESDIATLLSSACGADSMKLKFEPVNPGTYEVTFTARPMFLAGQFLENLIDSKHLVAIDAMPIDYFNPEDPNGNVLCATGVLFSFEDLEPEPGLAFGITFDPTNCNHGTYFGYDVKGNEIFRSSLDILIFALSAAHQVVTAPDPLARINAGVDEDSCLETENFFREQRGLVPRVGPREGYGSCCPVAPYKRTGPPPKKDPPKTTTHSTTHFYQLPKCFVATAAYGSPYADEVNFLRRIRDDVLMQSRVGEDFFRRFYRHYYRFSPLISEEMDANPEFRRLIRLGIVDPLLRYLSFAVTFPDAPLEDVPEPWASFLRRTRDDLERWTEEILGAAHLDGLIGLDAVREIATVLRYVVRSPERREAYLRRLEALGEIPLSLDPEECVVAREIVGRAGQVDVDRVVGRHPRDRA